ncbi:MAG: SIMPL domain-containing protein [Bacillota bacterium]
MKPQHFAALAGVLVVMALILLVAERPAPESSSQAAESPPRTVTVTGEGEMRAKPDQVTLTFGVSTWTQGASAGEAEALNLASRDRLTETLKRAGVDPDHLSATHPLVTPLTRQDYAGKTYLTGHQAVSRVTVTVTALQRADGLMAAGLANGATSLDEVVYGLTSAEGVRQRAVQAALENAAVRAGAIAQAEGQSLGDLLVVEVLEEEAPTPQSATAPGDLIFRVKVRATYNF